MSLTFLELKVEEGKLMEEGLYPPFFSSHFRFDENKIVGEG